jgi:predicted nucleic acid-binding protein
MPKDKVVSNTSPLLNLALIDRLELLQNQFSKVEVPRQVWDEIQAGTRGKDALEELRNNDFLEVVSVAEDELFRELHQNIDRGEAAALRYALEKDADLVLLDEKEARNVARRHDLPRTGVIGTLLKGAKSGAVDDMAEELDALQEAGFWISDELYDTVLEEFNDGS